MDRTLAFRCAGMALAAAVALMATKVKKSRKPRLEAAMTLSEVGRDAINRADQAVISAITAKVDREVMSMIGQDPASQSMDQMALASLRAPHNPHQQLITQAEAEAKTATQLVAAAGDKVPALVSAVTTIASRFEQFVGNIHALNVGLQEFKRDVMLPFRDQLNDLKYNTGDRLNHVSTDLEKYVTKLDQVMWAVLRAQGMSDDAIRSFRTEHGMTPEAPKGFELAAHMAEFEDLKASNERLAKQNKRLLARLDSHHFSVGESEWELKEGCLCSVCRDYRKQMQEGLAELNKITASRLYREV